MAEQEAFMSRQTSVINDVPISRQTSAVQENEFLTRTTSVVQGDPYPNQRDQSVVSFRDESMLPLPESVLSS